VCGALYEAYGMTYKQDWGLASSYTEVQTMYTSADCDTKLCTYFRHKYNATGPGKWGTLPTAVQPGWTAANCTSINSVCEMLMSEHFMVTPYVAYYGGSIATFSPNIYALDKCIKSTDCMAVDQGGTLRSNVFPLTQSPRTSTTCMYIRNTGGCPFVTNYLLIADSDHSGDTINAGVPSIDPAADCASESTCTAFTSNGDLKTMSYPVFQSPGTCLYLKLAPLIDSITCGTISDKYNYIAGVTNGAASYNLIGTIFEDANCWFKTCHYWYYKYGMTQTSWGSAPTSIRNAWNLTPCDDAILREFYVSQWLVCHCLSAARDNSGGGK
ncbi:hypothetical protein Vretimale_19291, partial [Volvox reticuliferus]